MLSDKNLRVWCVEKAVEAGGGINAGNLAERFYSFIDAGGGGGRYATA